MGESTTDTLPHLCPLPLRGDFLWLVLGKQFCKYFLEKKFPLFTDPSLFPISSPLTLTSFFFLAPHFPSSYIVCFSFPTAPPLVFVLRARGKKFLEKFFPYFPSSLFCFFFLVLLRKGYKKRRVEERHCVYVVPFLPSPYVEIGVIGFRFY